MNKFLKKLKLVECFRTELEIQKNEFIARFKEHVDEGSTGPFSDIFDIFSRGKNEYKGQIGPDSFEIKRKRKLFDTNMNLAVAKGLFKQKHDVLIIDTEINGFVGMIIPFYIVAIIIYSIFIISFLFAANNMGGKGFSVALPFIMIHAAFMFGIPYFMMRRSTRRMKYELEREFFYMTRKKDVAKRMN